ncbi:transcription initiation factor IIB [Modicella reniformis]|uniref:Transcription initiation factor IIB n=1 Tax=Modicella reniformis TaxID=1440133 RepID=A0A9P6M361_9FUNG|nr:transcription initiation factor IIB [Modicella reniformis]
MAPILDLNRLLICRDCNINPPNIVEVHRTGDLVCRDCGLVLEDRIVDMRSEWRTFADDDGDDPSRVGAAANPLLSGPQLDTVISNMSGTTKLAKDLSRMHSKVTIDRDTHKLLDVYKDISAMCDAIGLTKVIADTAKQLFKHIHDERLLRGRLDQAVMTACIYIACRQQKVPRSIKEILALTQVPKKEFTKCFKVIRALQEAKSMPMTAEDPMPRFCCSLQLNMEVEKLATSLVFKAKELHTMFGKTPPTIAATCIFMASNLCNDPRTLKRISLECGITEMTIRRAYKHLYQERDKLLDESLSAAQFQSLPSP